MKILLTGIFAVLSLGYFSVAQDARPATSAATQAQQQTPTPAQPSPGSAQAGASRIAPGSVIPVQLTKSIDVKKVKTGDPVEAKVTQDMKAGNGEIIVPKDTKVVGRVTEAQARSKEQKESQVGIAFDRAVMKDGGEMQMPMSIQAIIGPQNPNNQDNASGGNGSGSAPAPGSAGNSGTGRAGGMGGSGSAPAPTTPPTSGAGNSPNDAQAGTNARPPITAQTEGVVGISDLKLTNSPPSANEGSVVSSEKNNVKLESGTLMLLRVNQ